eukprot:scaffold106864_cov75-Phaeocystis_antarctica.AAC.2
MARRARTTNVNPAGSFQNTILNYVTTLQDGMVHSIRPTRVSRGKKALPPSDGPSRAAPGVPSHLRWSR